MNKTPAELQIELLKQLKAGKAPAQAARTEAGPAPSAPLKKAAPKPHALNVDAKTWGRLEERRRAEFKDTRQMAAWAARLVLALPVGVAAMAPEAQEDLMRHMRQWARDHGLS